MITNNIRNTIEEYNELNAHLKWEMIKANIKEVSQQYSRYKSREKTTNKLNLETRLNELERCLVNNPNDLILHQQIVKERQDLEVLELDKAKGAQIRSGCKFIQEGEKCTKLVLSLENVKVSLIQSKD